MFTLSSEEKQKCKVSSTVDKTLNSQGSPDHVCMDGKALTQRPLGPPGSLSLNLAALLLSLLAEIKCSNLVSFPWDDIVKKKKRF